MVAKHWVGRVENGMILSLAKRRFTRQWGSLAHWPTFNKTMRTAFLWVPAQNEDTSEEVSILSLFAFNSAILWESFKDIWFIYHALLHFSRISCLLLNRCQFFVTILGIMQFLEFTFGASKPYSVISNLLLSNWIFLFNLFLPLLNIVLFSILINSVLFCFVLGNGFLRYFSQWNRHETKLCTNCLKETWSSPSL